MSSAITKSTLRLARRVVGLSALCLLAGCCATPKQLSAHSRSAYRWTFSHLLTPEQDTKAHHLWQAYLDAGVAWDWAFYNPPSVTGFYNRKDVWALEDVMHERDKELWAFLDALK